MAPKTVATRSRNAWDLARRQHGVLARRQLLALGFTSDAIRHRVASGRLHPVATGIYAVGRRELNRNGRWMVAVLSCGDDALLSHGSAAALWGIGHERGQIDVTIRRRTQPRRRGIVVRSRPALPVQDVAVHRGIPVTTPPRTLLDQATQVEREELERQVNEADSRELIDPEALRSYLDLRAGEPGAVPLRTLLDRATFRLSDSRLEQMLRPLIAAAGLPPPQTRQRVNDFRVDFHWPDLGFVLEADSFRYHRTALKQRRDLVRDQTHVARGLVALRVSHWQVARERPYVVGLLRQVAARLAPPPRRLAPTPARLTPRPAGAR